MHDTSPVAYLSGEVTPLPWQDFLREFMTPYTLKTRARGTIRAMEDVVKALTGLTVPSENSAELLPAIRTTADLTVGTIARYVETMPATLSPNTVVGRLRVVHILCNYAWKTGRVRINPFLIRPIRQWAKKAPSKRKQFHRPEDIGRVLALMRKHVQERVGYARWRSHRLLALTSTLAMTGLRAGEGYHLEVNDLDLEKRLVYVRPKSSHKLKTVESENCVPMPQALYDVLAGPDGWLAHRLDAPDGFAIDRGCTWVFPSVYRTAAWTSGSPGTKPRDRMTAVAMECKPPVLGFNPLSLRHSFASLMVTLGAGPGTLKQLLRHSNEATQAYYVHRNYEALHRATADVRY